MNGGNGIVPTIDLATNNGNVGYPYPIMYGNAGFGGNGMFGGDAIWLIVLLALIWNGNNGGNGMFGGGNGFNNSYAWLSNGQKDIMAQTSEGFNSLQISNQIEGVRNDINDIQNAICSSTASVNSNVSNGFYNAEISACNRQMANMNQAFNSEIATLNGFNNLNNALQNCCCENRLATCQTQNVVQNEGNQTRFADANNTRDIITNATQNTQAILDKLCQLELDGKQDRINELERQVLMKDLQASQVAQTADLRASQAVTANQLVSELRSCPIPAQPVYGNQPIFTYPTNSGCNCGNYYGANIM